MLALTLGSIFVAGGWTFCGSSFSESLPPELSIETRVSIPTWSQPRTDLDLVAKAFAFDEALLAVGWEVGLSVSISSWNSSGESSKSSLSLFSVKFTLNYKIEKKLWIKHNHYDEYMYWFASKKIITDELSRCFRGVCLPDNFLFPCLSFIFFNVWNHSSNWSRHYSSTSLKLRSTCTYW